MLSKDSDLSLWWCIPLGMTIWPSHQNQKPEVHFSGDLFQCHPIESLHSVASIWQENCQQGWLVGETNAAMVQRWNLPADLEHRRAPKTLLLPWGCMNTTRWPVKRLVRSRTPNLVCFDIHIPSGTVWKMQASWSCSFRGLGGSEEQIAVLEYRMGTSAKTQGPVLAQCWCRSEPLESGLCWAQAGMSRKHPPLQQAGECHSYRQDSLLWLKQWKLQIGHLCKLW